MQKLYMKTYGCQMNVYDSDRMQDLMISTGYQNSETPDDADMIIINTCHIREKASEKLFCDLGRLKPFKKAKKAKGQDMIIAVAGCVAQAEGEEIFKRAPIVDIIVGPESYQTLPDLVGKVKREKSKQLNLDFIADNKFDNLVSPVNGAKFSSFVTVQEGCDKFCTFCVVPYTRGAEFSRPADDIIDEVKKLSDQGAVEIYLLGQNVNAYNDGKNSLADLIAKIAKINEIKRIRYTTSHPRDMSENLIKAHGQIDKLMPFLHLPIQSGSNNILKAMNRKHTHQDYLKIIDKLRDNCPEIGLSSDFIVGFPGESDQDFQDTLDLVEKINFAQCYSFKYSPRPGTPASESHIQIDEKIKEERLSILQSLLTKQQIAFNQKYENQIIPVLFEKIAPKSSKNSSNISILGKSPALQSVICEIANSDNISNYIGKIINVKIIKSRPSSLIGKILDI
jgi:tRNA-2-methylthio-N6-dimethylallyladenosine synthase